MIKYKNIKNNYKVIKVIKLWFLFSNLLLLKLIKSGMNHNKLIIKYLLKLRKLLCFQESKMKNMNSWFN